MEKMHIEDKWPENPDQRRNAEDDNRLLIVTSDFITNNAVFSIIDSNGGIVEWPLVDLDRVIEDLHQFRQILVDAGRLPEQRPRSG